jgi:delta-1-pyrroline-5-carboxylate synthetase
MNTLLLHEGTLKNGVAMKTMMNLRLAGVKCLGGPDAMKAGLCDLSAVEMKDKYTDLICTVEVVKNIDEAIDWIHKYGTGHTEVIVCGENDPNGEYFLKCVDAFLKTQAESTHFKKYSPLGSFSPHAW